MRIKDIIKQSPILIRYYKKLIMIDLQIPFWKGISISYSYDDQTWHTGRNTLIIAPVFYRGGCGGWCMNEWKFYHTGLYIGHRKSANGD